MSRALWTWAPYVGIALAAHVAAGAAWLPVDTEERTAAGQPLTVHLAFPAPAAPPRDQAPAPTVPPRPTAALTRPGAPPRRARGITPPPEARAEVSVERPAEGTGAPDLAATAPTQIATGAPLALPSAAPPPPPPPSPGFDRAAYAAGVHARVERHKRYPARARARGTCVVRLVIGTDGALADEPRIRTSSGNVLLDREALRMARAAAPYPAPPRGLVVDVPVRFH